MDAPRPDSTEHWNIIARLASSSLYLSSNQAYRGHCQLVFDESHACRSDELTPRQWRSFCDDLFAAQHAILVATRPDHINVELLGNVVPHLHWHIIPRYVSDPRWGMPIWTTPRSAMPQVMLAENDRRSLSDAIRQALPQVTQRLPQ